MLLLGVPVLGGVLGLEYERWQLDIVFVVAAIAADLTIWRTGRRSLSLEDDAVVLRTWRAETRLPLESVTDVREQYIYQYGRPLYLRGASGIVVDIINAGRRSEAFRHLVGARLRELRSPGLSHANLTTLRRLGLNER